jgi:large subunit ribosomal protein L25
MKAAKLEAKPRESKGKEYSHKLRRRGLVPGVIYGGQEDTVPLELDAKEMHRFLLTQEGENVLIDLKIAGAKPSVKKAVVKDVQLDPVTGRVLHVDFLHISMTEKIKVRVPVHVLGISTGVKNEGGILQHILRELEVSCLPSDIPASIDLDITELGIGDSLHVRDVIVDKVEILTDPERTIVTVIPPTIHKEEAAPVPEAEEEPEVLAEKKEGEEEEEEGKEKKAPPKEEETKAKQEKRK